jgi:hypothetical protein
MMDLPKTKQEFSDKYYVSRENYIKCWKYKKGQPGKHKYEKENLKIS